MIKQFHILIVFAFFIVHSSFSQQKIDCKLIDQNDNILRYSFDLGQHSYQDLNLHIEKKSIQYFNRSTFISILTKIEEEELEIARFYLSEFSSDHVSDTNDFSNTILYDFDVCLWQDVLKNVKEISLKTDGSFNEAHIDIGFTGTHGDPPVKVRDIIPLWRSSLEGFLYGKDGIATEDLPNRTIKLDKENNRAFIQVLVHGVAKNQSPSARFYFLNINNKEVAKRSIWRDDCAYNPIFPQSENWYISRPNWCPGLKIYPLKHHIPTEMLAGGNLDINLRFQDDFLENSGIYSYVVSAVLFVLDEPEEEVNVAVSEVLSPNNGKWHQRYNPICGSPVIIIKNLGKESLRQVTFNYGYNYQIDNKFRWKGELGFLEEEIVYLPPLNWYFFEKDDEPESFTAIISSANGLEEAFPHGKITTQMELAEVYPYRLTFHVRTDKNAIDNALEIFDDNGNAYFLSGDLVADTNYYFHVNFIPGCYEMILFDQSGDGVINRDKNLPVLEIIDQKKGTKLRTFNGDFGGEIREQFMIFR